MYLRISVCISAAPCIAIYYINVMDGTQRSHGGNTLCMQHFDRRILLEKDYLEDLGIDGMKI
jgi:hypothetical protein